MSLITVVEQICSQIILSLSYLFQTFDDFYVFLDSFKKNHVLVNRLGVKKKKHPWTFDSD